MSERMIVYLQKIRMINWYGFNQITVPVGKFTLIAGKNGNGKSVLLDGIKYALYGDTVFNKSSENKGSRTVTSYTRGLKDATLGTYMRPADQCPNVHTHIVLEFANEVNRFILGTVIDTDAANNFRTFRYEVRGKRIEDLPLTFTNEKGEIIPVNHRELQEKLGVTMYDNKEGLQLFMQRTGLRFEEDQLVEFRRNLRNIMSYDPGAKIDQFIRESVLEEKKIDFSKLVEVRNNIQNLKNGIQGIDEEIQALDEILHAFEETEKCENTLFMDDVKQNYQKLLTCQQKMTESARVMELADGLIAEDEQKLKLVHERREDLLSQLGGIRAQKAEMDCDKTIAAAKTELERQEENLQKLQKEKKFLQDFQQSVNALLDFLTEQQISVENKEVLQGLAGKDYSISEKTMAVQALRLQLGKERDARMEALVRLRDAIVKNENEKKFYHQIVEDCRTHKTTYSELPDYLLLKQEINKELEKRNGKPGAWMACEMVTGLEDETWRNTLETYLGRRRYTVLVEPENYSVADEVLNRLKNPKAHLFNTAILMKKTLHKVEQSAADFIQTKNAVTRKYFDYQLGRFAAVELQDVKKYENALSKEGRVSVAMDGYFLNFAQLRYYYLGNKALELNRQRAEKMLKKLTAESEDLQRQSDVLSKVKGYLEQATGMFVQCNYDAVVLCQKAQDEVNRCKQVLEELMEAQKHDEVYMRLCFLEEDLERNIQASEREENSLRDHQSRQRTEFQYNQKIYEEHKNLLPQLQQTGENLQEKNSLLYDRAVKDYENHLAKGPNSMGGILKDRRRAERNREEAKDILTQRQADYAVRFSELGFKTDRSVYEDRKKKIWMDDRQEIQHNLEVQTGRYEEIFKNEFVLEILRYCNEAREKLKSINLELKNLKFKDRYAFHVQFAKDGSRYEQIINYAKFLQERVKGSDEGQLTLDSMSSISNEESGELEREIRRTINEILAAEDKNQLENYADYRNYMSYEILLSNDVFQEAKLSRQSGYNSGAEVQIPYLLILISALLMKYNTKDNCTRLVFIDEPFAKMDPTNIQVMLDFMKSQELQMVFCAPDKTELLGNACEVILPVLRLGHDVMEIGTVQIKEPAA